MHRPGAAVAVRVRFIAGKTHAGISVYCAPDTVDLHIQLTAYHHHMFDHPGFVRRGLAQRAGRQGDGEMVELKLFIEGKSGFTTIACCCGSNTACGSLSGVINAEKGTFNPVAIFHKVETVGLDSLRSICPSIAFDTPVSSASFDRLQPRA